MQRLTAALGLFATAVHPAKLYERSRLLLLLSVPRTPQTRICLIISCLHFRRHCAHRRLKMRKGLRKMSEWVLYSVRRLPAPLSAMNEHVCSLRLAFSDRYTSHAQHAWKGTKANKKKGHAVLATTRRSIWTFVFIVPVRCLCCRNTLGIRE